MTLFIRCITVMTVVLGMATMAVSAYAAKTEVVGSDTAAETAVAGVLLEAETPAGVSLEAEVDGETYAAPSPTPSPTPSLREGSGTETAAPMPGPLPMPTVAPHYAVPFDAAPLARMSPRRNAAPLVQVWSGPSLKPILIQASAGGSGIPSDQLAAMQQESQVTGIPWQIFAAIARIESDFGRNMSTSWAGAIGYGQFLPVTWVDYGNGGDPYNFRDVIPAMGRYLLVAGVLEDPPRAIYAYNHSWSYVSQVLSYADAYGYPPAN